MDMTSGRIAPQILRFAFPVLLGLIFQRIYNFVDSYIVGHYLGDNPLAAVNIAGTAMYLVLSLILGLTTGITVVLSQYYGAGQEKEMEETYFSSIYITLGMTVIITVAGLVLSRPLLILLRTPSEVLTEATRYLQIVTGLCIGSMVYNWIASVLRALGNSWIPLVFLGVSSGLNIVLDILFVAVLPFGVKGAAYATVLAQLISGILCFIYAWRVLPMCRFRRGKMKFNPKIGRQMLKYGLPAGLQMSIISISDMTLQAVVNTFGTVLVVAYGVGLRMEWIGMLVGDSLGQALGTFAGQNTGAKNIGRIKSGFKTCSWMCVVGYAVVSPLVFLLAPWVMRMFTSNAESIQYGVEYMHIFSIFLLAVGMLTMLYSFLRAVGDVRITVWTGICEVISRIGLALLLSYLMGYHGLWWVSPLTWCIAFAVAGGRYLSGAWKKKIETT